MILKEGILPDLSDVVFKAEDHTYWIGTEQLPSVTTIMSYLSDAMYGSIDKAILEKAADKGTAVHESIENIICFGIEDIKQEYQPYIDAYKRFLFDYNPIPIATEIRMYHKFLRYSGTGDFLCYIGDKLHLIDYKTTSQLMDMLVKVQLEAYAKALESHGVKVDGKAALQLKKDGSYKLELYQTCDKEAWSVFGSLLSIRQYIQKYRRIK